MLDKVNSEVLWHELRREIFLALLIGQQFLFGLLGGLDILNLRLDAQIHLRNAV